MSTNAFNGLQNLQLAGPISITERIASGLPVRPVVDFPLPVADFTLRGNDNLHPEKDLNLVISAISNGIQPNPSRKLIQQLVPVDPFTPNSFPKANDFLVKTDTFIQQVLNPAFGSNFSAPVNFIQTTPFGLPIPDVGNNAEPLRLFAVGTGAPFSTINNVQTFNGASASANTVNSNAINAITPLAVSLSRNTPTMLQASVNNAVFTPSAFGMDLSSLNFISQQQQPMSFIPADSSSQVTQGSQVSQLALQVLGSLVQNLNALIVSMIQRPNTLSSIGSQLLPLNNTQPVQKPLFSIVNNNQPLMTVFRVPFSQNS